jgi:hypothetical protein
MKNPAQHRSTATQPALATDLGVVALGRKLPDISIRDKGILVPSVKLERGRMVMDGKDIQFRPWKSSETDGKVRTIYHLAGRIGIDGLNKPFIDALIAAKLPEQLPDSPYKTITILNLSDTLWGTHGIAMGQFEDSQRNFPYALHVADEKGVAREAWDLEPKQSAVIILDKYGSVLFFKEGRLSAEEIRTAVGFIKSKLERP